MKQPVEKRIEKKNFLKHYLLKAGIEKDPRTVAKNLLFLSLALLVLASFVLSYMVLVVQQFPFSYLAVVLGTLWILGFPLLLIITIASFFFIIDLIINQRKTEIEEVLADFLQLTAANIRAGMPIDRALWYAVRPRFGVLAKEINMVAKETTLGKNLEQSLIDFAEKFDSGLLKRAISLLVEGLDAGGEMGELLNKIADNIKETQIMKKEMSANVTTYAIFITFATILAAPFLMSLSYQLVTLVRTISSTLDIPKTAAITMPLNFSKIGITPADFRIFAIVSLTVTSFFSGVIVATIKKGDAKLGIRYIPIFIAVTILLFFGASMVMKGLFGSIF